MSDFIADFNSNEENIGVGFEAYVNKDMSNYYTKPETDAAIANHHDSQKADATSVYTKAETNTAISNHHDSSKADATSVYTKQQVDSALAQKSTVTVSASGSATDEVSYITVDGVEKKIAGGSVDSVNGQTGVVVLDAEDVGALPSTTVIPTKTSDLTNDGDGSNPFLTQHQDISGLQSKTDNSLCNLDEQGRVVQSILAVDTKIHTHSNKSILDTIGSDAGGLYWED